jgi:hypothetical protein
LAGEDQSITEEQLRALSDAEYIALITDTNQAGWDYTPEQVASGLRRAGTSLSLANEAMDLNPVFPDWYLYFKTPILIFAGRPKEALDLASGVADSFIELPGWFAIAAGEVGDEATMRDMAARHRTLTQRNWAGDVPWTKVRATEWFLSVNRWLIGRQRDLTTNGLRTAGLL